MNETNTNKPETKKKLRWIWILAIAVFSVAMAYILPIVGTKSYVMAALPEDTGAETTLVSQKRLGILEQPENVTKIYLRGNLVGVIHDTKILDETLKDVYAEKYAEKFPGTAIGLGEDVYVVEQTTYYDYEDIDEQLMQYLEDNSLFSVKANKITFSNGAVIYVKDLDMFQRVREQFILNFIDEPTYRTLQNHQSITPLNTYGEQTIDLNVRETMSVSEGLAPEEKIYTTEEEILKIAVKSMSLDDLRPFDPKEKVIEYLMEDEAELAVRERLVRMSVKGFAAETASESPAPGGGSISAYMGALGAALATMVANLSAHKRGWDDRWKEFSDVAEKGQALMAELLALVDEDTAAFNRIMDVFSMPKGTAEEKAARAAALEEATLYAASVPLRTMEASFKALPLALEMAQKGNPASASDAGVAALAAVAAIRGAALNVRINAAGLADKTPAQPLLALADDIVKDALALQDEVLAAVNQHIEI